MHIVDLLWLWIAYFLVWGTRAWRVAFSLSPHAGDSATARFYDGLSVVCFALACGAFVFWLGISGYGR